MKRILRGLILAALVAGCATSWQPRSAEQALRERVARAYGIEQFHTVGVLRFTCHAQRSGKEESVRVWEWEPKRDRVSFSGQDADGERVTHTYQRHRLRQGDAALNERMDRWFINDQYWLLFPFHLQWDRKATVTTDGMRELPIPPGEAERVTIRYPKTGGYTPGDSYELFVDPDGRIQQWIFHKGGAPEPSLIATWEQHVPVGPIVVSLQHRSADGSIRVWFTDVSAQRTGQLPAP